MVCIVRLFFWRFVRTAKRRELKHLSLYNAQHLLIAGVQRRGRNVEMSDEEKSTGRAGPSGLMVVVMLMTAAGCIWGTYYLWTQSQRSDAPPPNYVPPSPEQIARLEPESKTGKLLPVDAQVDRPATVTEAEDDETQDDEGQMLVATVKDCLEDDPEWFTWERKHTPTAPAFKTTSTEIDAISLCFNAFSTFKQLTPDQQKEYFTNGAVPPSDEQITRRRQELHLLQLRLLWRLANVATDLPVERDAIFEDELPKEDARGEDNAIHGMGRLGTLVMVLESSKKHGYAMDEVVPGYEEERDLHQIWTKATNEFLSVAQAEHKENDPITSHRAELCDLVTNSKGLNSFQVPASWLTLPPDTMQSFGCVAMDQVAVPELTTDEEGEKDEDEDEDEEVLEEPVPEDDEVPVPLPVAPPKIVDPPPLVQRVAPVRTVNIPVSP